MIRTYFVTKNLMTPLKLTPNCCVIMLCRFMSSTGHFFNHLFLLISSTSTSSATSEYGTVAERLSRNEEQSSRNEERSRNTPSSSQIPPQKEHSKLTCAFKLVLLNFITLGLCYFMNFSNIFQLWKIPLIFVYTNIYCVGAGLSTSMSISDGFAPCIFRQKDGKDGPYEGRIGWKAVDFPPESAFCLYS